MEPMMDSRGDQQKNLGFKLLQKWGYEPGKGLGKELQGINKPVQANLRKGRCGFGFDSSKKAEAPSSSVKNIKLNESKPCKNESFVLGKVERNKGKKTSFCREKNTEDSKFKHKQNKPRINTHILKCKVIDMTKPEPLVFNNYHGIRLT